MKYKHFFLIAICIMLMIIIFSNKKNAEIYPVKINKTHTCEADSMILMDYKGPKAQILWKDQSRSFYCEVKEAFHESTDKIKNKNIKAFFVQNFSNLDWDSYDNNWILAENAYYVIDSKMDGAMGITYVPFDNIESAKLFFYSHGGIIITYDEISKDTLNKSSLLLKDRIIF